MHAWIIVISYWYFSFFWHAETEYGLFKLVNIINAQVCMINFLVKFLLKEIDKDKLFACIEVEIKYINRS